MPLQRRLTDFQTRLGLMALLWLVSLFVMPALDKDPYWVDEVISAQRAV